MPGAPDDDRRPVPQPRDEGPTDARLTDLFEAPPEQEQWTGNWATEHPTVDKPPAQSSLEKPRSTDRRPQVQNDAPARTGSRWSGYLAAVLMLAAAALLFWAPWKSSGTEGEGPSPGDAAPSVAALPSGDATAQSGATAGQGDRAVNGPIVPTRISIPAIGVNTTVEHHGTVRTKNAFTGRTVSAFGVPTSMRTTSWWSDGPEPGSGQMAVILGHTQVGGYGVFNKLGRLQPGSPLTLRAANGDTLRLQVLGPPVTGLDKATPALANTLDHHPAGAALALVTCGGQFDRDVHASEDNVVVFASVVPAG